MVLALAGDSTITKDLPLAATVSLLAVLVLVFLALAALVVAALGAFLVVVFAIFDDTMMNKIK